MDITSVTVVASLAFLFAGCVKGIAGIGLPTAAIAGMTLAIEPRVAISLILFPMLGINGWQWLRGGHVLRTILRYKVFATVLCIGVVVTSVLARDVDDRWLAGALGVAILIFVAVSWRGWLPPVRAEHDTLAQFGFATLAGGIGGLTAAWAAPLGMYLSVRQVEKDEFIRATGFLVAVGSIPLAVSYAQLGFLGGPLALTSALMIVPALAGYAIGEKVRNRLSPAYFRNTILLVFLILGLNLIRRAYFGA
ncbi:sulfite exporter TauE/SafE family protein [Neptunicoccus cionae]|uniref:sulfite exporter TauE/SafE family protein n=1 Tax=Neptunicoccus cionae TaxID=2035344 RepID=UPI000C787B4F|nr:sulfite exporter TauE/SafE family protein [Amylibacter cionae]PLS20366.1 sulfite exporter TauE/SafE family protein [Amylibacter cionae]